jgi:cytochrome c oxidase subunit 2
MPLPMSISTRSILIALPAAAPLSAHAGPQSVMHPKGESAALISDLASVMFIGGGAIFLFVMALTGIALFGPQSLRDILARRKVAVVGGGILFPLAVLSALTLYAFFSTAALVRADEAPAARIEVTGELWWWRVKYRDANGEVIVETANEIHIPAGLPVDFTLTSADVIHSFWVPNLAGKIDMLPGHVNRLRIRAEAPGVFRGQCAEYCGAQHANMAFQVVAHAPADYASWLATHVRPAAEPDTAFLQQGRQAFFDNGCGQCHVVHGTPAAGGLGPDLTHVGSRLTLAAGIYPNGVGPLAGWIAGSQQLKPGNRMPSFGHIPPEDLRALAAYMHSLQ